MERPANSNFQKKGKEIGEEERVGEERVLLEKDEFIKGNAEKALKFDAFFANHQTQLPNLSFCNRNSGKTNSCLMGFVRFTWQDSSSFYMTI